MAKKEISGYVKLQIKGGQANPAPPVGPALGQRGINIMEFCKAFNEKTKEVEKGQREVPITFELRVGSENTRSSFRYSISKTATVEEMEQFLKPQKPNVVPIKPIAKFNADEFVKEWIEKMTKQAEYSVSQNAFEKSMQTLREHYQAELQQISTDLMQQAKIDGVENTLKKQITNRRK